MQASWWKEAVIYQIYPRSFKDSTGDGIGDLRGILEKVPYLHSLGVDIVWLSPVYQSPNDDNGYDISDYYRIMEEFGTMADFDALLQTLHDHGIRLLMDLVVNHTSDEHQWFQQSRLGPDNPYHDYYIWRPPGPDGGLPNNWKSFFSGSTWTWDEQAEAYYLHLFSRKQPDLNWENPLVRQEVYKVMRFWLDKGVDGFRMDVIPLISKVPDLPDLDWEHLQADFGAAYANGPRVHEFLQEMHSEVLAYYDLLTIGEGIGVTRECANHYVGADRKELHMVFHFDHMFLDHGPGGRMDEPREWIPTEFMGVFEAWEAALGDRGWGSIYLGNHDFPRAVSRFGNDGPYREISAKLLATLLMTRKGTPTIYQGDEIGMKNTRFHAISEFRDVELHNAYREKQGEPGFDEVRFLAIANQQARDHARTPMLWEDALHGGFSTGTPWIKVSSQSTYVNVAAAEADPGSVLNFYRSLIRLRKADLIWVYGDTVVIPTGAPSLYAYARHYEQRSCSVWLNFSTQAQALPSRLQGAELLLSNYPDAATGADFRAWEARIYRSQ